MILKDNHKNTVNFTVAVLSVANISEFKSDFPTNGPSKFGR